MAAPAPEDSIEEQYRRMSPVTAPEEQKGHVVELFRLLEKVAHAPKEEPGHCKFVGPQGESISIPESVFYGLERVAEVLARGDAITIVPVGKELTTQQAANLLNVSRQYLVRLLDAGNLPYTKTGKHRRLKVEDVLAFKRRRARERKAALDDLTEISEEFTGYDELK